MNEPSNLDLKAWRQPRLPEEAVEFQEWMIEENHPFGKLCSLRVGGNARYYIEVTSIKMLAGALDWARARSLPIFILGEGSNLLVSDNGFPGLVLRIKSRFWGLEIRGEDGDVLFLDILYTKAFYPGLDFSGHKYVDLRVGAGENWWDFAYFCTSKDLAGFECLAGIPGTIGATPIQNVGAYGQEVSDTILSVEALDLESGRLVEFSNTECEFGYRTSRFKTRDRGRFIITSVTYRLIPNGKPMLRYAELQKRLEEKGQHEPTLLDVSVVVTELRRAKGMVLSEDPDSVSAGSFFVNPILTSEEVEMVKARAAEQGIATETMPAFPAADDAVKLSAAWLIERTGIHRGFIHGNVGTSTKHSLAIINRGGGTAREVKDLAELIQAQVYDVFGVRLMPEPVFVGFEESDLGRH